MGRGLVQKTEAKNLLVQIFAKLGGLDSPERAHGSYFKNQS